MSHLLNYTSTATISNSSTTTTTTIIITVYTATVTSQSFPQYPVITHFTSIGQDLEKIC